MPRQNNTVCIAVVRILHRRAKAKMVARNFMPQAAARSLTKNCATPRQAKIQWREEIESCLPKPFNLNYGFPGEQHGEQNGQFFSRNLYLAMIAR